MKKASAPVETNGASSKPSLKLNGEPARQVKPRKRAADFLSDDEDAQSKTASQEIKKAKSAKKDKKSEQENGDSNIADTEEKESKAKKSSKPKKKEIVNEDFSDVSSSDASEQEDDEDEDDQTAALIKGFESSGDEEDASGDEGFDPEKPVPKIPDSKKLKRKLVKKQKSIGQPEETGTVYVGYGTLCELLFYHTILIRYITDVFLTVSTSTRCAHTFRSSVKLLAYVCLATA